MRRRRAILVRCLVASVVMLALSLVARRAGVRGWFDSGAALRVKILQAGVLAPVAYIGVYLVAPYLMLPRVLPATLSGALFGVWRGFGYTYLGSMLAASASFWAGRWIGVRARITQDASRRTPDGPPSPRGLSWLTICAIRLVPLMPGDAVNVTIAQTPTPFGAYLLGTALGAAPSLALYAALGEGMVHRNTQVVWLGGAGLGLLLLAGVLAIRRRRASPSVATAGPAS
ncbi:MAG: TVP38/TMEM64 family protein [Planctomycetes bacterium]|nr:TVP38/TMEM64 family protein [Planctomycetota bacterium]